VCLLRTGSLYHRLDKFEYIYGMGIWVVRWCLVLVTVLAASACNRDTPGRQYELTGQVLEVRSDRNQVVIRHQDIPNFMPGMTMPFTVKPPSLMSDVRAGDLVTATLVVEEVDAYLSAINKTGTAPLPAEPPPPAEPLALQPGQAVEDAALVDQDGAPFFFSGLKGHRVALTFIYTRCPLPDFCPLMDRQFQSLQKTIAATPALSDVRLVTATLDPAYDTPAVLKPYAAKLQADPARWSFLTGDVKAVSAFGAQFGLYIEHDPQKPVDIIHNLRTAVVDANGRLVKIHTGNSWTTTELLDDIAAAAAPAK
jgi:protein SCO1